MNKHIAKLREQLVKDMDRLTAELADIANAINAIDGMGAAKAAVAEDGRKRSWTPERRAAMSAKMKMQHEANPDTAARRAAALEHGRRVLAERRANGEDRQGWYA